MMGVAGNARIPGRDEAALAGKLIPGQLFVEGFSMLKGFPFVQNFIMISHFKTVLVISQNKVFFQAR
jgi:hypothetical protein